MKYWWFSKRDKDKIYLDADDQRILSIEKTFKGFYFQEECDGYFGEEYTKEEALGLIEELKKWINET